MNKSGREFGLGLAIIFLAISLSLFAFITEDNKITGFATLENQDYIINPPKLLEFKYINSIGTLAPGNYYIDGDGIVYWTDDESRPAIAKVNSLDESQKSKDVYIDNEGRVGYTLGTNEK